MHPFSTIQEVRSHLLQANTDQALRLLERRLKTVDKDLHDHVLLLTTRFNRWQSDQLAGLKPDESIWVHINQALLALCTRWENFELDRFWANRPIIYTAPSVTGNYSDEKWQVSETKQHAILENVQSPAAIKYHWLELEGMDTKRLPLSVRVRSENTATDGAISALGLLLNWPEQGLPYLAYCVDQDNCLRLYQRDETGLPTLMEWPGAEADEDGFHLLQAFRFDDTVFLFHNGQRIEQLSVEVPNEGAPGIWAWGTGRFHFRDLSFYRV